MAFSPLSMSPSSSTSSSDVASRAIDGLLSRFASSISEESSEATSPTSSRRLAVRLLVGGGSDLASPDAPTPHLGHSDRHRFDGTGHVSSSSPCSPHLAEPLAVSSAVEGEGTGGRRKLRKASQSERVERPRRQPNASGSSKLKQAAHINAWEVCDLLAAQSGQPTDDSRPSAADGPTSRRAKSAVAAGADVCNAAAAAAEAAHEGRWLASGFEELQLKLERFARNTQRLAESLDEARQDAHEAREALRAARAERDMLVTETESTLAAWSAAEQAAAARHAALEAENAELRRRVRRAEDERDAAVVRGKSAATKAAAAAVAAARPVTVAFGDDGECDVWPTDSVKGRCSSYSNGGSSSRTSAHVDSSSAAAQTLPMPSGHASPRRHPCRHCFSPISRRVADDSDATATTRSDRGIKAPLSPPSALNARHVAREEGSLRRTSSCSAPNGADGGLTRCCAPTASSLGGRKLPSTKRVQWVEGSS